MSTLSSTVPDYYWRISPGKHQCTNQTPQHAPVLSVPVWLSPSPRSENGTAERWPPDFAPSSERPLADSEVKEEEEEREERRRSRDLKTCD